MALQESTYKNFIPSVWSARLLEHLDMNLVAQQMVTRDYEGDISDYGDIVYINQIGNVTIKEYTGADIDAPEELTSTQQQLVIDQAKYFNFMVKDIDAAQANVRLMDEAMDRAGVKMAEVIDADIFAQIADNAGIKITNVTITPENAYTELVKLRTELNQKNVPIANRKIVLPPFYTGYLMLDARFVKADTEMLKSGVVGRAAGFEVIESNNLKAGASESTYAVGGSPSATNLANQIVKTEAFRPESNFADAVKGLNVWGRKVTQPNAVFSLQVIDGGITPAVEP